MCVQRFDDSLDPAIRITYRISRRSSSLWEPRDPSLKDVWLLFGCCLVLAKVRLLARGKKLFYRVCFPRASRCARVRMVQRRSAARRAPKQGPKERADVGQKTRRGAPAGPRTSLVCWVAASRRGVPARHGCREKRGFVDEGMSVLMILPQVHLRKPCYDFSFLEMFRFK